MDRIDMWAVLIFIVVASCNAELHPKETASVPPKKIVGLPEAESRIVGGTDTTIEKYPFAVQIYYHPKFLNRCGGSLVSLSHVLTAAACFCSGKGKQWQQNMLSDYTIRASTSILNSGGSVHTITDIKIHEQFDFFAREHNLAVVLLNIPIDDITSVARPVYIVDQGSEISDKTSVTAVGWGWYKVPENIQPTFLNEVTVPTMNMESCKARYMDPPKRKVPSNTICTGSFDIKPGKGPCMEDIGGALLFEKRVVGIISFNSGFCIDPAIPFVYVKVASYAKWINDKINDIGNCSMGLSSRMRQN